LIFNYNSLNMFSNDIIKNTNIAIYKDLTAFNFMNSKNKKLIGLML